MALENGIKAPKFKALANGNKEVKLEDYKGKWLVLYFYPKDNTSGCTKEACGFNDSLSELNKIDAEVLGVSPDSVKSHENFIEKFKLNFDLLSDSEKEIAQTYQAWGEKSMYGRKYMGIIRSTFIINPKQEIAKVYSNVKVNGHVEKVISDLKELQS